MFFGEDTIQPKTGCAKIILDGEIKAKNVRIPCRIMQIIKFWRTGVAWSYQRGIGLPAGKRSKLFNDPHRALHTFSGSSILLQVNV